MKKELSRTEIKKQELETLYQEFKKNPTLFERQTFDEGPSITQNYGIYIKDKEDFPYCYLKFLPQDFIVEEIGDDNSISTISLDSDSNQKLQMDSDLKTIYATLVKCGMSTIEAVEEMSTQLKCHTDQIQYAGIKDKDAITSQRISFRNIPLEKIKSISSPYFFLKNLHAGKGVVEKGNLVGNRFTILIRIDYSHFNIKTAESLRKQIIDVKKNGFYNFYYLQRFGTPRLINIKWGMYILRGQHKEAIKSFISESSERELPYFRKLRQTAEKKFGNWTEILKLFEPFPMICRNELKAIRYLEKHPEDFIGALSTMPDQITLWIYAIASLLFNEKISSLAQTGKPIPKDLPLFLSNDRQDILVYQELLQEINIFPPPFNNLRSFPFIRLNKRTARTKEFAEIHKVEVVDEGIIMSFSLSKGNYATTLLSHFFNLVTGKPPEWVRPGKIDIKKIIGEENINKTIEKFHSVIHSKNDNPFELFE